MLVTTKRYIHCNCINDISKVSCTLSTTCDHGSCNTHVSTNVGFVINNKVTIVWCCRDSRSRTCCNGCSNNTSQCGDCGSYVSTIGCIIVTSCKRITWCCQICYCKQVTDCRGHTNRSFCECKYRLCFFTE